MFIKSYGVHHRRFLNFTVSNSTFTFWISSGSLYKTLVQLILLLISSRASSKCLMLINSSFWWILRTDKVTKERRRAMKKYFAEWDKSLLRNQFLSISNDSQRLPFEMGQFSRPWLPMVFAPASLCCGHMSRQFISWTRYHSLDRTVHLASQEVWTHRDLIPGDTLHLFRATLLPSFCRASGI